MYEPYQNDKPAGEPYGKAPVTFFNGRIVTSTTSGGGGGSELFTGAADFQGATGIVIDEVNSIPIRLSGNLLDLPTTLAFENDGPFSPRTTLSVTTGTNSVTGETTETFFLPRSFTGVDQFAGATGVIIDEIGGQPLRWSGSALEQPTRVSFENSGAHGTTNSFSFKFTGKAEMGKTSRSNEGGGGAFMLDGKYFENVVRGEGSASGGYTMKFNYLFPRSGVFVEEDNDQQLMYIFNAFEWLDVGPTYGDYMYVRLGGTGHGSENTTNWGSVVVSHRVNTNTITRSWYRQNPASSNSNVASLGKPGMPAATENPTWTNLTITVPENGEANLFVNGRKINPSATLGTITTTNNFTTNDLFPHTDSSPHGGFGGRHMYRFGNGGGYESDASVVGDYSNYNGNGTGQMAGVNYFERGNTYASVGDNNYGTDRASCGGSGFIGDFALYSRQLTDAEVYRGYKASYGHVSEDGGYIDLTSGSDKAIGAGIGADALTGWWRMRPATVSDAIASGNQGRTETIQTVTNTDFETRTTGFIPGTHDISKSVRWTGIPDPKVVGEQPGGGNYIIMHSDTKNDIIKSNDGFSVGMWVKFPTSGVPISHEIGHNRLYLFSDANRGDQFGEGGSFVDYCQAWIDGTGSEDTVLSSNPGRIYAQVSMGAGPSKGTAYDGATTMYTEDGAIGAAQSGTWNHLLFTFQRTGNGSIYLNGEDVTATRSLDPYDLSKYGGWSGTKAGLSLGARQYHLNEGSGMGANHGLYGSWEDGDGNQYSQLQNLFGSGQLAEFAMWGNYLTAAEVSGVYNTGAYVNLLETSGSGYLSGWWRMDPATTSEAITSGGYTAPVTITSTGGDLREYRIGNSVTMFT